MASIKTIFLSLVAAASLTNAAAVPTQDGQVTVETRTLSARAAPQWYSGTWDRFPGKSTWKSFDDLFNRNDDMMKYAGSTQNDINRIKTGINAAASQYKIDNRVLLAMIMQESHGYVGVRTTYSWEGIPTAGIMQCSGCPGFPGLTNLSQAQITSMILAGAKHFRGNLDRNGGDGYQPKSVYPALREYNSGNVNHADLSDGRGATPSYVSDVVQRLGGWFD
ncbi:uncharacterized protein B0I36DRAFT_352648 [Microdochium trichocladiopsis]|uniref:Transglycosylase SLT domain-containing protein n=1 Tax=Microdochium trichocladiopsis TaxID=1682393 RepID=A0A9P8XXJ7_9PEZI|nr:uncharacterized protein B0I36DRAFT_352648 [Microdochium trichocladiopsis]KAH7024409.1 hypothetical protein B0I36DRAFT_352648 [Microdochium trichocladiopsis]